MPDELLRGVEVRPILPDDRDLFDASLNEHHWLGYRLAGRTMRYVATDEHGRWLALLGFGAAALSCRPRDGGPLPATLSGERGEDRAGGGRWWRAPVAVQGDRRARSWSSR